MEHEERPLPRLYLSGSARERCHQGTITQSPHGRSELPFDCPPRNGVKRTSSRQFVLQLCGQCGARRLSLTGACPMLVMPGQPNFELAHRTRPSAPATLLLNLRPPASGRAHPPKRPAPTFVVCGRSPNEMWRPSSTRRPPPTKLCHQNYETHQSHRSSAESQRNCAGSCELCGASLANDLNVNFLGTRSPQALDPRSRLEGFTQAWLAHPQSPTALQAQAGGAHARPANLSHPSVLPNRGPEGIYSRPAAKSRGWVVTVPDGSSTALKRCCGPVFFGGGVNGARS